MTAHVLLGLLGIILVVEAEGVIISSWIKDSACGNWMPYGQHKCLTILNDRYNNDQAETMCALASGKSSQLIRVSTKTEQDFLQRYLFEEQHLNDSVWLGITVHRNDSSEVFEFIDKSWAKEMNRVKFNYSTNEEPCVEMASGVGNYTAGTWLGVLCNKSNIVVCERPQIKPLNTIESIWSSMKQQAQIISETMLLHNVSHDQVTDIMVESPNETVHIKNDDDSLHQMVRTQEPIAIEVSKEILSTHSAERDPSRVSDSSEIGLIATLIQRLEMVEEEVRQGQLLNQKANEEISALKQESTEAKQEITLLKQLDMARSLQLNAILNTCEKRVSDLEKMKENAEMEIDELFQLGKEATKDISLVKHKNEATEMVVSEVRRMGDNIEKEISDMKSRTEIVENELTAVRTSTEQLEEMVKDLTQRDDSRDRDVAAVQEGIEEIQAVLNRQTQHEEFTDKKIKTIMANGDVVEGLVKKLEAQLIVTKTEVSRCKAVTEVVVDLNKVKNNPVPVGFIYTQLPNQLPPAALWPSVTWKDVSSMYAGLFFRTVGRNAAAFGVEQSDQARHINYITSERHHDTSQVSLSSWPSARLYSGGGMGLTYSMRFRLSSGEVRPRNTAVRIWVRID